MHTYTISKSRQAHLIEEINIAISKTPMDELDEWRARILATISKVTVRRGKNLASSVWNIGKLAIDEGAGTLEAIKSGDFTTYITGRGQAANETIVNASKNAKSIIFQLSSALKTNPSQEIPKLAAGIIGFFAASGGVDGDGGVPDLDFLGGIGAHRSIFTHSVIAGIVIETLLLSLSDLTKTIHRNLPEEHDPIWESLVAGNEEVLQALSQGISAGIAYHLAVDATLDSEGTYKDLPVSLPQDVHQVIIASNALAEGNDSVKRNRDDGEKVERSFHTFKEASEFAKKEPGTKIVRDSSGFVVK